MIESLVLILVNIKFNDYLGLKVFNLKTVSILLKPLYSNVVMFKAHTRCLSDMHRCVMIMSWTIQNADPFKKLLKSCTFNVQLQI